MGETTGAVAPVIRFGVGRAAPRPVNRRDVVLTGVLLAAFVAGAVVVSLRGQAARAQRYELQGGTAVLAWDKSPAVVDLATGQPTLRINDVATTVGAERAIDVDLLPVDGGTWVVDRRGGGFNLLGPDNLVAHDVIEHGPVRIAASDTTVESAAIVPAPSAVGYVVARTADGDTLVTRTDQAALRFDQAVQTQRFEGVRLGTSPGDAVATPQGFVAVERIDGSAGRVVVVKAARVRTRREVRWKLSPGTLEGVSVGSDPAESAVAAAGGVAVIAQGGDGGEVESGVSIVRGATSRHVDVPVLDGADRVLAARATGDRAWFQVRTPEGWKAFGVSERGEVTATVAVGPADRTFGRPGLANGSLYTADTVSGEIWRVPTTGQGPPRRLLRYPDDRQDPDRASELQAMEVFPTHDWLIVNSRRSEHAVLVDRTGRTSTIRKSAGLIIRASAAPSPDGIGDDKKDDTPEPEDDEAEDAPPPKEAPTVTSETESARCKGQRPLKPTIARLTPASNSMHVTWRYETKDALDCQPNNYVISAEPVGDFPGPTTPVRQTGSGQLSYDFTGLRPNRVYRFVVAAVIDQKQNPSEPVEQRTETSGPATPGSISATARLGGWTVRWDDGCGSVGCDVPVARWEVSASLCNGGVGSAPPTVTVEPSGSSAAIELTPDLVGRSLSFAVTATSPEGRSSTGRGGGCTEAWTKPDASKIAIDRSTPVATSSSLSTTVTVGPQPGSSWEEIFGSSTGDVTITLDGMKRSGRTATFSDLEPGDTVKHTLTVSVSSRGGTATTDAQTFSGRLGALTLPYRAAWSWDRTDQGTVTLTPESSAPLAAALIVRPKLECGGVSVSGPGAVTIPRGAVPGPLGPFPIQLSSVPADKGCTVGLDVSQGTAAVYENTVATVADGSSSYPKPQANPVLNATWSSNGFRPVIKVHYEVPAFATWTLSWDVGCVGKGSRTVTGSGDYELKPDLRNCSIVSSAADIRLVGAYLGDADAYEAPRVTTIGGTAPTTTTLPPTTTEPPTTVEPTVPP